MKPSSASEIVGREAELTALRETREQVASGYGASVIITGEAGIGKSRLAAASCADARAAGFFSAWGRCAELGNAPTYWPWKNILRAILGPKREHALDPYEKRLLAHILPEFRGSSVSGDAFELLDTVRKCLVQKATERPIWLGLEDLHASDTGSLELLAGLVDSLQDSPILIVGTARSSDLRDRSSEQAFRVAVRGSRVVPLQRLERDSVEEFLVRNLKRGVATKRLTSLIYGVTEGLPLFLVELTKLIHLEVETSDLRQIVPESVRATVRERVLRLSAETQELLSYAAICGRVFEPSQLESAFNTHLQPQTLHETLDAQIAMPIESGGWKFSHVVVPKVVADLLDQEERETRHATWAAYLLRDGASNALIASHYAQSGAGFRIEAQEFSEKAGDDAANRLAFSEALEHYRIARALLSARDGRGRVRLERSMGITLIRMGSIDEGLARCQRAYESAVEIAAPVEIAKCALAMGSVQRLVRVDTNLKDKLERALQVLPKEAESERVQVLARLAGACQPALNAAGPVRMALEAVSVARRLGDRTTLMGVLRDACAALVDMSEPHVHQPLHLEFLRLAETAGEHEMAVRARIRLLFSLFELGRTDEAWGHVQAAIIHTETFLGPKLQWQAHALRCMRCLWRGEHDEAHQHLERLKPAAARDENVAALALLQRLVFCRLTRDATGLELLSPRLAGMFPDTEVGRFASAIEHVQALLGLGRVEEAAAKIPTATGISMLKHGDRTMPYVLAELSMATANKDLARAVHAVISDRGDAIMHLGVSAMVLHGPGHRALGWVHEAMGHKDAAREHHLRADRLIAKAVERAEQKVASHHLPAPIPRHPTFEDLGDVWKVVFNGAAVMAKKSRGMSMLALLVKKAGADVHVLDLTHPDGLRVHVDESDAGVVIDTHARAAYVQRARTIKQELAESEAHNDLARAEVLREELDAISDQLLAGTAVGGRLRQTSNAAERARVNVRKRLTDAINRLSEAHPQLGKHLRGTIRTGMLCRYDP